MTVSQVLSGSSYLVRQRHPDLPDDWEPSQGLDDIKDAYCGFTTPAQQRIAEIGVQVVALLLQKNREYGDSALNPVRIFAKDLPASAGIRLRLDDKLSRLVRGASDGGRETPIFDLTGYLILLMLAEEDES